jgi:pimeloyl-ACP methyl ester carboxylesterase
MPHPFVHIRQIDGSNDPIEPKIQCPRSATRCRGEDRMSVADANGAQLFYTDDGVGDPPIVFVHGFSCDSHDWSWQLPYFGASHRVIALDLRGHGRSSAPADGYDLASLAAGVLEHRAHVGGRDVIAVGHSLGGVLVSLLAVERPDLVRAVVAVDPGHLYPDEYGPALSAALTAYETEEPGPVAKRAFDAGLHVAATPAALVTWHNRRAAGLPVHVARATVTAIVGGDAPFILRSNSAPYLARARQPVLSFYVDPHLAALAAGVFPHPSSRIICFEGSGHWLHQERPAEFNNLVDGWLRGVVDGD